VRVYAICRSSWLGVHGHESHRVRPVGSRVFRVVPPAKAYGSLRESQWIRSFDRPDALLVSVHIARVRHDDHDRIKVVDLSKFADMYRQHKSHASATTRQDRGANLSIRILHDPLRLAAVFFIIVPRRLTLLARQDLTISDQVYLSRLDVVDLVLGLFRRMPLLQRFTEKVDPLGRSIFYVDDRADLGEHLLVVFSFICLGFSSSRDRQALLIFG
jgi:hypothetical protein